MGRAEATLKPNLYALWSAPSSGAAQVATTAAYSSHHRSCRAEASVLAGNPFGSLISPWRSGSKPDVPYVSLSRLTERLLQVVYDAWWQTYWPDPQSQC